MKTGAARPRTLRHLRWGKDARFAGLGPGRGRDRLRIPDLRGRLRRQPEESPEEASCLRVEGHPGMCCADVEMAIFLDSLGREESFDDILTYQRACAPKSDCKCGDCAMMRPS
jgi:hypothetical protein